MIVSSVFFFHFFVFLFFFHIFDFYLNYISASAAAKSVYFCLFFWKEFFFNIEMLFIVVA